jgi:hypothetical protein
MRYQTACLISVVLSRTAAAQTPQIVTPGSGAIDGRRIPLANSRYKSTMGGRSTDVMRDTVFNGQPALLRILTVTRPNATTIDTILLMRSTLAPVWKHAYAPGQITFTEFHGNRVTGTRRHDGAVDSIDVEAPVPVFEAFSADLPLAALDLKENLHVRLPVYHPTLGFTWLDASVGAPQSMPAFEKTWPIVITEGTMKMTWFVDLKTREQAGAVNALPNGGEVRITREP